MNKEQFELAKIAILADCTYTGLLFGSIKGQSCAIGGLFIAADPDHPWEYYLELQHTMGPWEVVEEFYGLTSNQIWQEIIPANDNRSEHVDRSVEGRQNRVIAVLENILGQS